MTYEELIVKALRGRSVNQAAKDWNINQVTLNNYVRGDRIPPYPIGIVIAREANVDLGIAFEILAEAEARKKPLVRMGQLGLALSTLLIVSVNLFLTPGTATAEALPYENASAQTHSAGPTNLYYVK
jgi:hypothetical protein